MLPFQATSWYELGGMNILQFYIPRKMIDKYLVPIYDHVTPKGNWLMCSLFKSLTMLPSQATGWYNLIWIFDHVTFLGNWLI